MLTVKAFQPNQPLFFNNSMTEDTISLRDFVTNDNYYYASTIDDMKIIGKNILSLIQRQDLGLPNFTLENILINIETKEVSLLIDYCIVDQNKNYQAPEIYFKKSDFNYSKVKSWTLGILLYEAYFREFPFETESGNISVETFLDALNHNQNCVKKDCENKHFINLLNNLICLEEGRLSLEEALEHSFFN